MFTAGRYSGPNNILIIGFAKITPKITTGIAHKMTPAIAFSRRAATAVGKVLAIRAITGKMLEAKSVGMT